MASDNADAYALRFRGSEKKGEGERKMKRRPHFSLLVSVTQPVTQTETGRPVSLRTLVTFPAAAANSRVEQGEERKGAAASRAPPRSGPLPRRTRTLNENELETGAIAIRRA